MSELSLPSDWRPTASIENLRKRAAIVRRVREFFDAAGFFEVHTPCLSGETVVDLHLAPIEVDSSGLSQQPGDSRDGSPAPTPRGNLYLQTSPEAAMKRLLAAGASAIYQIGPVFRSDERGPLHNPEFAMLEWYRTGDSMAAGIELLGQLVTHVLGGAQPRVLTYQAVFEEVLGFDPFEISHSELIRRTEQVGYQGGDTESRDDYLDVLIALAVTPRLSGRTIISNYPISQAALARRSDWDPRTAERFELFIDGVELANGYAELLDAEVLRRRTEENNRLRRSAGRRELPAPNRLLAAMQSGLPSSSGTAVGLDRLVMAALRADRIEHVIPFPIERA